MSFNIIYESKGWHKPVLKDSSHFEYFKSAPIINEAAHWGLDRADGLRDLLVFDFDLTSESHLIDKPIDIKHKVFLNDVLYCLELDRQNDEHFGATGVVFTGYGFHLYIFFEDTFNLTEEDWLFNLVEPINFRIRESIFKLDSGKFHPKQNLRLPNSLYVKGIRKKQIAKIIKEPINKINFLEFKERLGKYIKDKDKIYYEKNKKKIIAKSKLYYHKNKDDISIKNKLKRVSEKVNGEVKESFRIDGDPDFSKIINPDGCRFLVYCGTEQDQVSESEWKAMLSLVCKGKDKNNAYKLALEMSEEHPKFSLKEFDKEFERFSGDKYNPYSCTKIQQIWKDGDSNKGCAGCPHRTLNMPLNIGLKRIQENIQIGFRIPVKKGIGMIQYPKLTEALRKEYNFLTDTEGNIWHYKLGYWESLNKHTFLSSVTQLDLIKPTFQTPSEQRGVYEFFTNDITDDIQKLSEEHEEKVLLKNKVIDIRTGDILVPSKDFYKLYSLNFEYDADADCPIYKEVVKNAFKNTDPVYKEYFFKFIVNALFKNENNPQACMVLYGKGANGKSTLMNGIMNVFNNSNMITAFSLSDIADRMFPKIFKTARIAYCADITGYGTNKRVDKLKKIISRDEQSYRGMQKNDYVIFKPKSHLIVGLNEIPTFFEGTEGMKRRFKFIEFKNIIPAAERDTMIDVKVEREKAGIFNYLVEWYKEFLKNPTLPELKNTTTEKAVHRGNPFEDFFENYIEITGGNSPSETYTSKVLFLKFNEYLDAEGIKNRDMYRRRLFTTAFIRKFVDEGKVLKTHGTNNITIFSGFKVLESEKSQNNTETIDYNVPF